MSAVRPAKRSFAEISGPSSSQPKVKRVELSKGTQTKSPSISRSVGSDQKAKTRTIKRHLSQSGKINLLRQEILAALKSGQAQSFKDNLKKLREKVDSFTLIKFIGGAHALDHSGAAAIIAKDSPLYLALQTKDWKSVNALLKCLKEESQAPDLSEDRALSIFINGLITSDLSEEIFEKFLSQLKRSEKYDFFLTNKNWRDLIYKEDSIVGRRLKKFKIIVREACCYTRAVVPFLMNHVLILLNGTYGSSNIKMILEHLLSALDAAGREDFFYTITDVKAMSGRGNFLPPLKVSQWMSISEWLRDHPCHKKDFEQARAFHEKNEDEEELFDADFFSPNELPSCPHLKEMYAIAENIYNDQLTRYERQKLVQEQLDGDRVSSVNEYNLMNRLKAEMKNSVNSWDEDEIKEMVTEDFYPDKMTSVWVDMQIVRFYEAVFSSLSAHQKAHLLRHFSCCSSGLSGFINKYQNECIYRISYANPTVAVNLLLPGRFKEMPFTLGDFPRMLQMKDSLDPEQRYLENSPKHDGRFFGPKTEESKDKEASHCHEPIVTPAR